MVCTPPGPPKLWPCNLSTGTPSSFKASVIKSYIKYQHISSGKSVYDVVLWAKEMNTSDSSDKKRVWLTKGIKVLLHTFHTWLHALLGRMPVAFSTLALPACCLQGTEQPLKLHRQWECQALFCWYLSITNDVALKAWDKIHDVRCLWQVFKDTLVLRKAHVKCVSCVPLESTALPFVLFPSESCAMHRFRWFVSVFICFVETFLCQPSTGVWKLCDSSRPGMWNHVESGYVKFVHSKKSETLTPSNT